MNLKNNNLGSNNTGYTEKKTDSHKLLNKNICRIMRLHGRKDYSY